MLHAVLDHVGDVRCTGQFARSTVTPRVFGDIGARIDRSFDSIFVCVCVCTRESFRFVQCIIPPTQMTSAIVILSSNKRRTCVYEGSIRGVADADEDAVDDAKAIELVGVGGGEEEEINAVVLDWIITVDGTGISWSAKVGTCLRSLASVGSMSSTSVGGFPREGHDLVR
jgi:hypothetical protein